jgi:hypothetical protein
MSADFFFKKFVVRALLCCFVLFICGICFLTAYFQSVKKVFVSFRYYYLVCEDAYTEAGAIAVYNEGGASYFLEDGKNEWLALAVYTNASEAQSILENLSQQQKDVVVVEKGVEALYFKGSKQKTLSETYVDGLKTFDGYIRVLEECIYRLDDGLSQEKARGILLLITRQLKHCGDSYAHNFPALSKACMQARERLEDICSSVIMAKDLRYLVCEMAEENIARAKEFVL